jgi:hypothetical protein
MDIVTTSNFHATLLKGARSGCLDVTLKGRKMAARSPNCRVCSLTVQRNVSISHACGLEPVGQVSVVFIPAEHLRRCSWPLLK